MKDVKYTEEELELLEYMESNPKSVPHVKEEIEKITNMVKEGVQTRQQVNFRLNNNHLDKITRKA